jgi:hypothetical protein
MSAACLMLFLAIASVAVANADQAYFRLKVNVDGTGRFLDPTIKTATIERGGLLGDAAGGCAGLDRETIAVERHDSLQCHGIYRFDMRLLCRGMDHWPRERPRTTCRRRRIGVIRDCALGARCYGAPHEAAGCLSPFCSPTVARPSRTGRHRSCHALRGRFRWLHHLCRGGGCRRRPRVSCAAGLANGSASSALPPLRLRRVHICACPGTRRDA